MAEYKMIPVDKETKDGLIVLAKRFGFRERGGQGLMVSILVKEKLQKLGLSSSQPVNGEGIALLVSDGAEPMPAIDDVA